MWLKEKEKTCFLLQLPVAVVVVHVSRNLCCNKSGVKKKNQTDEGNSRVLLNEHNAWSNCGLSLGKGNENGGRWEWQRKNKNAGRPKVKLSIKGKQQYPSNFYFSKYKANTIVHTKSFVLGRSGSEKAPQLEVHVLSAVIYEVVHYKLYQHLRIFFW